MGKDYYKTLGVEKSATADEVKKAFRKKAHEHHPDKGNGNADKFKEVNEAYQVLGNDKKRKQYDQFGTSFEGMGGQAAYDAGFNWSDAFRQGGAGGGGFRQGSYNINIDDLGDIFGDFFGGGQRQQATRRNYKGRDIEAGINITLEEAIFGIEKTLDISKNILCEKCKGNGAEPGTKISGCKPCGGSGQVNKTQNTFFGTFRTAAVCEACMGEGKKPEKECAKCHGNGIVRGKERVKVGIPAGISTGETVRLTSKGEAGLKGSTAGDLYITVRVLPHKIFNREGDNLHTTKTIKFSQASLGDKVQIETLDGKVSLKIPAGTPTGRQFNIKNKGSHKLRGRGRGDLIVEVKVEVPDNLSRKQKKLLEDLEKEGL